MTNKHKSLEIIKKYRTYKFGTFDVKTMELVYNDWYQKAKFVEKLAEFNIKK